MATIKQIAELAGVSRGTVDRVLNNRGSVNANTAARVREIAEKLNKMNIQNEILIPIHKDWNEDLTLSEKGDEQLCRQEL
jgi:LacI family transcriptional regulator